MAVLEQEIVENQGLVKELDMESIKTLMNMFQKDIYTRPVDSAARENACNLFDAIAEKLIAISILKGESEISDHFVEDDRPETKASKFNPDYFDINYLDQENNMAVISYRVADDQGKDVVYFQDYGVGLGGARLAGFFKPGHSTKRLSKSMLGKYGK